MSEYSEGSGKAVEKPGKCNKSCCGFFFPKEGKRNPRL